MKDHKAISDRKADHIALALKDSHQSAQGAGLRVKLLSMLLSCCALSCCAMSRAALRASVTLLLARVAPYLPTTPVNRKICYAYYGIPQIVAEFIL